MTKYLAIFTLLVSTVVYAQTTVTGPVVTRNALPAVTQTKTFSAGAASDTTIDVSDAPMKYYALQVGSSVGVATWDVRVEGSLDGTNFTQIVQHETADGADLIQFGSSASPVSFVR